MSNHEATISDGAFQSDVLVVAEKPGTANATVIDDSSVTPSVNSLSKPAEELLLAPSGDLLHSKDTVPPVLGAADLASISASEPIDSGGPTRDTHIPGISSSNPNTGISVNLYSEFSLPDPDPSNFARNVQWCADGQAVLVVYEDSGVEVLTVGEDMEIKPGLRVKHPAPVLSTAWFPTASPVDPASYCFVVAVRDCPVKLLDASDGRMLAGLTEWGE
ncbi:hypothetical protein FRC10_002035 [Ceratobasidium sp. 414]|nr:hypothetical protein FRC10_002035 [Ceratobasidium sp. 414]